MEEDLQEMFMEWEKVLVLKESTQMLEISKNHNRILEPDSEHLEALALDWVETDFYKNKLTKNFI